MTTKSTSNAPNPGVLATVNMTYDDANRLKTYNGEAVRYDEKGNMTYGPVDGKMQELTYDCRNRLVEAGGITYTYDAENTRIATTEDGLTTEYITDTGGSLSRMITAYEADNTETLYYYGAEGLAAQYNTGTGEYYAYHYDNIGSTTLITDRSGQAVERFSYGTYGELLKDAITKIRFLYNGSYGVATDRNGLYYMRARYYNPDIKRFINQDIKVGDIGSSQSLNRYAYCEGNPVSLVDPFGLSPEGTQDKGKESKYQWLHNVLFVAGFFFDGADLINGALYAMEGDYVNAAISVACGIPAVGTVIAGVAKGTKAVKAAAKIADVCKAVGKAGNVAASVKSSYDTYMQARSEGKSAGEALAYTAGAMAVGIAVGKAAQWGAKKVTDFAKANLPKMVSSVKESAGRFVNKVSSAFQGGGSSSAGRKKINRGCAINPFYKGESGSGIVEFKAPPDATPEQIEQVKNYVDGCNQALQAGKLSSTGRVSTKGSLRRKASKAAKKEAKRAINAGKPYTGHVGHVPDTTWTGNPDPYDWLDLDPIVNASLGGQANKYPIGYKPTGFIFKEDN